VGKGVGNSEVGVGVGGMVGWGVGTEEGTGVGCGVGTRVGCGVGTGVGTEVGTAVGSGEGTYKCACGGLKNNTSVSGSGKDGSNTHVYIYTV
jgi:hypothetical protein